MKLQKEEIQKIRSMSDNFISIRDMISDVENRMEKLKNESTYLVNLLESQRSEESDFIGYLQDQYGPGKLDLTSMEWVKEESNYV